MFRRNLPTAITLAAVGMSLFTCVQAGEYARPYATAPTVTSTIINGKEILIDVPAGKSINLPTGTRLWPASPIVISDGPIAEFTARSSQYGVPTEYNVRTVVPTTETPSNQSMRVFTIKYANQTDGYAANRNVINPTQHVEVNSFETILTPSTSTHIANDQPAEEFRATEWTEEPSQDDTDTTKIAVAVDEAPPNVVSAETDDNDIDEIENTDIASTTSTSDIAVDVEDASSTTEFDLNDSPENGVDLYADSIDPQNADEDAGPTKELVADVHDSNEDNEPSSYNAEWDSIPQLEPNGTIQLVIDEEDETTQVSTVIENFKTIETASDDVVQYENPETDELATMATNTELPADQIPMPVFAKETRATKSELPWLLPFVFFSAIGLAWAERMRRNRAKARFARAMEHGRRVQRTEGEASQEIPSVPMPTTASGPSGPTKTIVKEVADPAAISPTTSTVMLNDETPSATNKRVSNPLPPMVTVEPTTPSAQAPINEAASGPMQDEESHDWVDELTGYEVEYTKASDTAAPLPNAEPAPVDSDEIAFVDTDVEEIRTKATDVTQQTNAVAAEEPKQDPTIAKFIELQAESVPASDPQPTDEHWLKKMRDAEGNTVEEDVELDQLTGLLEDANSMRAEWAGFEQRSVDFRDRWADREQQKAGADQQSNDDQPSD